MSSTPQSQKNNLFFAQGIWRWGWQLALYFPLFLIGFIGVPVAGGILTDSTGLTSSQSPVWQSTVVGIVLNILQLIAVIALTGWAHHALRKSSLRASGFALTPGWLRHLLLGALIGTAIIAFSILLSWSFGWYQFQDFSWNYLPVSTVIAAILAVLVDNLTIGTVEEVAFRGYIFSVLRTRWGIASAVFFSSLFFGVVHLINVSQVYPAWMVIISLTLLGAVFALAYLVTGTLWLAIGIHFAVDAMPILLSETTHTPANGTLVVAQITGNTLITGPAGAGEGLFDMIGLTIVGCILLFILLRRRNVEQQNPATPATTMTSSTI